MLRSILDIRRRSVNEEHVNNLWKERALLRRRIEKYKRGFSRGKLDALIERIEQVQRRINRSMFVPDYVTVVIDKPAHYKYIHKNGVVINGKRYHRFSCSAGQARVSTIVMVCDEIADELERRLNNGRDMTQLLAPSKFNAYFGLASSATKQVSEPRFIVVKDYENICKYKALHLIEQEWDKDDLLEERYIEQKTNRTDGMGLISPELSEKWAKELGLDWIPSQWIIRQNFIKGMVCTFPFREFAEEINHGNYEVNTVYTDTHGRPN